MKRFIKTLLICLVATAVCFAAACSVPPPDGDNDYKVTSVTLDKTSQTLIVGESFTLVETVIINISGSDEIVYNAVDWTTNKSSVASITADGTVTAKTKGTATITATAKADTSKKATCEITVIEPIHYLKDSGTYKAGTDIDSGEYLLIADTQNDNALSFGYYQVTKTNNATVGSSDFLYNDNFFYRTYVNVEVGQYLSFQFCKLYKIDDYPAVNKNAKSWNSGQYKIGVDLEPGHYELNLLTGANTLGTGYLEITKTANARVDSSDFISNRLFQSKIYATLEADTYFRFQGATMTKIDMVFSETMKEIVGLAEDAKYGSTHGDVATFLSTRGSNTDVIYHVLLKKTIEVKPSGGGTIFYSVNCDIYELKTKSAANSFEPIQFHYGAKLRISDTIIAYIYDQSVDPSLSGNNPDLDQEDGELYNLLNNFVE